MMQPTEDRDLSDGSIFRRFDGTMDRAVFTEPEKRPVVVITGDELSKNAHQVAFIENNDVVETIPSESSDRSFAQGVLPGRPWRAENLFDAHVLDSSTELLAVGAIEIADEIFGRGLLGESLYDLLRGPLCRGRIRDVEVKDFAALVVEDEENEDCY